jgi:hypothetical protein
MSLLIRVQHRRGEARPDVALIVRILVRRLPPPPPPPAARAALAAGAGIAVAAAGLGAAAGRLPLPEERLQLLLPRAQLPQDAPSVLGGLEAAGALSTTAGQKVGGGGSGSGGGVF